MDFRTWLRQNDFGHMLNYTGNDGGISTADYVKANSGNDWQSQEAARSMAGAEAAVVKGLYGKYNQQQNQKAATPDVPSYSYDPNAAARAAQAAQNARERDFTIGMIDNQINDLNSARGRLDGQLNTGLNTLGDDYNRGMSRLNQQQSRALSKYATQRSDNKRNFLSSSEDNRSNARNSYTALMQMLGRAGAGSSSAAENVVPYAVSQTASKQQGALADNNALNVRNVKLAEDETKENYKNSTQDLLAQRRTNERNLRQSHANNLAQIEQQIGSLVGQRAQVNGDNWQQARGAMDGHRAAANNLLNSVNGLADQFRNKYNVKNVKVKEAALQNFAVDPSGMAIGEANGPGYDTDTSQAYQQKLKEEEKRKNEQLAYA